MEGTLVVLEMYARGIEVKDLVRDKCSECS